jgi:hypothetical protein
VLRRISGRSREEAGNGVLRRISGRKGEEAENGTLRRISGRNREETENGVLRRICGPKIDEVEKAVPKTSMPLPAGAVLLKIRHVRRSTGECNMSECTVIRRVASTQNDSLATDCGLDDPGL